jgi:4a-hydroxytetrahydrobiopterin dehydratase
MRMAEMLSDSAIADALAELDGWALDDGKLHRVFKFAGFVQAFGFMTSAAIEAEKMDHHPEWSNVYSKVSVHLVTHSVGGITNLDIELAKKMNALARSDSR